MADGVAGKIGASDPYLTTAVAQTGTQAGGRAPAGHMRVAELKLAGTCQASLPDPLSRTPGWWAYRARRVTSINVPERGRRGFDPITVVLRITRRIPPGYPFAYHTLASTRRDTTAPVPDSPVGPQATPCRYRHPTIGGYKRCLSLR